MAQYIGYYSIVKIVTLVLICLLIFAEHDNKEYYFYAVVIFFLTSLENLIYSIVQDRKEKGH
jgi:hypothetical membrane protein